MEITHDTIAAIATPPGTGGIAVIRLSGPQALSILGKIWTGSDPANFTPRTVHLGTISDTHGTPIDQTVATFFKAPASFTGEDTIEISCHGSTLIQRQILHAMISAGARAAQPGEFTQRAFLNGRIDLTQAEAIADLIAASSQAAHDIALAQTKGIFSDELANLRNQLLELTTLLELELDFSEEDIHFADRKHLLTLTKRIHDRLTRLTDSYASGNAMRQGIAIAIAGAPNTGKSTLLNRLSDDDKAIVSDIPGTTRDTIEATATINGLSLRFIDTAGIRPTDDQIENLGIQRAIEQLRRADFILWLIDPTHPLEPQHTLLQTHIETLRNTPHLILITKADISEITTDHIFPPATFRSLPQTVILKISALTGQGIPNVINHITETFTNTYNPRQETVIANARHYEALSLALQSIGRVKEGLETGYTADMISADLRDTISHLGVITGAITTPEILSTIFSRFCIGK